MPHFCQCGSDEYICQVCGKIRCSREQPSVWGKIQRLGTDGGIEISNVEGNICPDCQKKAGVQKTATRLGIELYGMTKEEAHEKKICLRCKRGRGLFKDKASAKEYWITGFCQKCQDEVSGEVD